MIGIERRIDIVLVGCAVGLLCRHHGLHVVRGGVATIHDLPYDALGVREGEVKERVDATGIELRDGCAVRPGFSHQIAVWVDAPARLDQESHEVDVCPWVACYVGGHGIQAEPVHALVQPKLHDVANLGTDHLVAQIEVGHLVPKPRLVVPRRSLQWHKPVKLHSRKDVVPHVRAVLKDGVLIGWQRTQVFRCRAEPWVRVGGVVEHEIHQNAHPAFVAFLKQGLVIRHSSKGRIDGAVVVHVILVVGGRRVHGSEP